VAVQVNNHQQYAPGYVIVLERKVFPEDAEPERAGAVEAEGLEALAIADQGQRGADDDDR
jgi:hypothetical protein